MKPVSKNLNWLFVISVKHILIAFFRYFIQCMPMGLVWHWHSNSTFFQQLLQDIDDFLKSQEVVEAPIILVFIGSHGARGENLLVTMKNCALVLHWDRIVKPPTKRVVRAYQWESINGGRLCGEGEPTAYSLSGVKMATVLLGFSGVLLKFHMVQCTMAPYLSDGTRWYNQPTSTNYKSKLIIVKSTLLDSLL